MTQHSNETLHESLSALVDGEASELEIRRLLKSGDEPEVRDRWHRYQLAGALMRREVGDRAPEGFADRVSAALDEQPALRSGRHWWQRAGQMAVAASVAGAVLVGIQQYPGSTTGNPVADSAGEESAGQASQPAALPAGYHAPSLPSARPASAESGYNTLRRPSREVRFVPIRAEDSQVPAEEVRAYFDHLMRAHSDHAARNSNQGVLPFARVSSEDEE